jgi:hypothetical protein
VIVVAWELPDDPAALRAWLAAPPHRAHRPSFNGVEGPISHWSARYERFEYPDALDALVKSNVDWLAKLRARGLRPRELYSTHIRYAPECCGEVWRAWPALLLRGLGDCEDLAAARCSELLARRVPARVELQETAEQLPGTRSYHVLVRTPRGLEDPSALLGDDGFASCDPLGPRGLPCADSLT